MQNDKRLEIINKAIRLDSSEDRLNSANRFFYIVPFKEPKKRHDITITSQTWHLHDLNVPI